MSASVDITPDGPPDAKPGAALSGAALVSDERVRVELPAMTSGIPWWTSALLTRPCPDDPGDSRPHPRPPDRPPCRTRYTATIRVSDGRGAALIVDQVSACDLQLGLRALIEPLPCTYAELRARHSEEAVPGSVRPTESEVTP